MTVIPLSLSYLTNKRRVLWAPWRMEYIRNTEKSLDCIFCVKPSEDVDRKNLIVHRGSDAFVIMNRYPYNSGHLMIVPYRHTAELSTLTGSECAELFQLLARSEQVLKTVLKPHGFNIGMNLGRIAGAGVEDHLHFHIVPRWNGDTNFMPLLGHAKVVSEGLEHTWERLVKAFPDPTSR